MQKEQPPSSRRLASVHGTLAFRWVRVPHSTNKKHRQEGGAHEWEQDYGTRLHYGAAAIQPAAGKCPPDTCICWVRVPYLTKKKRPPNGRPFLFGGDYGTRTCDLMRVKHAL